MAKQNNNALGAHLKRWGPLAVLLCLLVIGYGLGLQEHFSLSSIIQNREMLRQSVSDNFILTAISFMALYTLLVALSFPGASLLTIAGGLLFGGIAGGMMTVVAATAGATIIFMIARSSFGDFLQAKAGPFVGRMVEGFQKDAFQYLLTLRLMPVFPFWVINIVPALLNMKLLPYAAATFVGIIPGTIAYSYIGAGLDSVVKAQQEANPGCAEAGNCAIDVKALVTTEILIAMAALAAISILPVIIRKLRPAKNNRANNNSAQQSGQ